MAKAKTNPKPDADGERPMAIAVLDRGWVYLGEVDTAAKTDWLILRNAQCIRRWGTTRGLGQLAIGGPTPNTVLDPTGTVRVPAKALISLIDTEARLWTTKS